MQNGSGETPMTSVRSVLSSTRKRKYLLKRLSRLPVLRRLSEIETKIDGIIKFMSNMSNKQLGHCNRSEKTDGKKGTSVLPKLTETIEEVDAVQVNEIFQNP